MNIETPAKSSVRNCIVYHSASCRPTIKMYYKDSIRCYMMLISVFLVKTLTTGMHTVSFQNTSVLIRNVV